MMVITKRFDFSAAHHLGGLPTSHPCSRVHGHNYSIELELRATVLTAEGFVLDYRALDVVKEWIDEKLDHRDLNEVFGQPTAENIAFEVSQIAASLLSLEYPDDFGTGRVRLAAVRVKETEKTSAEYRP